MANPYEPALRYPDRDARQPQTPDHRPNGSLHSFTNVRFTLTDHGHFLIDTTLADHGETITYKASHDTWFVISGVRPDGTEYYRKFHTRNGNWAEFIATYPHRLNQTYDPVVEHLAKTFEPFLKGNYDRIP